MGVTAAVAAALGAATAVYSASEAHKAGKKGLPTPPQPERPPSLEKAPDVGGIKRQTGQALGMGPASTLLTGTEGVSAGSLNLGKSTLLGG